MKIKLFLATILGCVMLSGCESKVESKLQGEIGNNDGNITNIGSVCQKGDTIYYQNFEDKFSIYKSVNGGEGQKLNSGTSYFINVVGDYVYYVHEDSDFHIYKMKTDGSENTEIVDKSAYYMTVYNDYIYFVNYDDNQALYKVKTDGSELKKLVDTICYYPIVADDGYIYYIDYKNGGKVTRITPNGDLMEVMDDKNPITAAYLNYNDGKLYYTNAVTESEGSKADYQNFLFCYDIEKKTTSTVIESPCADINIYDGRIYYNNLEDSKVYSCNLKGEDKKLICDENGMFINLTDESLYCYIKELNKEPYIKKVDLKWNLKEDWWKGKWQRL